MSVGVKMEERLQNTLQKGEALRYSQGFYIGVSWWAIGDSNPGHPD